MHTQYLIGDWLVQPELRRIEKNGHVTQLEPKVMEVLLCLIQESGNVVSREQLIQRVWPDTFVTDDVVKRCIWQVRKAFDDDPKSPKVIETIPKGGYRLMLAARVQVPECTITTPAARWSGKRKRVIAAGTLVAGGLALMFFLSARDGGPLNPQR